MRPPLSLLQPALISSTVFKPVTVQQKVPFGVGASKTAAMLS